MALISWFKDQDPRMVDIFELYICGYTQKAIAKEMDMKQQTISNNLKKIKKKLCKISISIHSI